MQRMEKQSKIAWRKLRTISLCPISESSLLNRLFYQAKKLSGYKYSLENKGWQQNRFHLSLNISFKKANWYSLTIKFLLTIQNILTFCYLTRVHDSLVKNNSPKILKKVVSYKYHSYVDIIHQLRGKEYYI